jgi:dTDP-4-amino-4,6-dideoxygalactose transaminase
MRDTFLPFHVPQIESEEIESVEDTLRSGWLSTGPKTQVFESEFANFLGTDHAIAVNSCTAALHLALDAVGITNGDEVLVPTMTFAATAAVVTYCGAKPVLVDCEPDTLNIDAQQIPQAATSKTKAVIPVHFAGQPCDMTSITQFAAHHNWAVIEDAAHALPAYYRKAMAGTVGDIGCFSFYATKTITTGEGGMAVTNHAGYAESMRLMRSHGMVKDAWNRYSEHGSWYYDILRPGYKYNMNDIAAALGITQLRKCERLCQVRTRYAGKYDEGFADLKEIVTPMTHPGIQHAWHLYVIQLQLDRLRVDRNEFIERLKQRNIGTGVHFIPLHLHPYYRNAFGYRAEQFPCATSAYRRIISLPIYPKMSEADVQFVIDGVRAVVRECRR